MVSCSTEGRIRLNIAWIGYKDGEKYGHAVYIEDTLLEEADKEKQQDILLTACTLLIQDSHFHGTFNPISIKILKDDECQSLLT